MNIQDRLILDSSRRCLVRQASCGQSPITASNRIGAQESLLARRPGSPAPPAVLGGAVAITFAREGADILIAYLNEHDDAGETQRLVQDAGRAAVLVPGDIQSAT